MIMTWTIVKIKSMTLRTMVIVNKLLRLKFICFLCKILNSDDPGASEVQDRNMGGRIIGCLRLVYANKQSDLEPRCISEITEVIEASKVDIKLDIKLYQQCKQIINNNCSDSDKEDCLKLLYQHHQITNKDCQREVKRIIQEGQADIHVDQLLLSVCRVDLVKHCNDIPPGRKLFILRINFIFILTIFLLFRKWSTIKMFIKNE